MSDWENSITTYALNIDALAYPKHLAPHVGMSVNEIAALKRQGCPFFGRKTTLRVVRAFIYKTMGAESLIGQDEHHQHLAGNIVDE